MKKALIKICVYLVIGLALIFFFRSYVQLRKSNIVLKSNQEILLSEKTGLLAENAQYRVSDSLNAIKAEELRLTIAQYKKYYAENMQVINKLRLDKRDMQKVIDLQATTIDQLTTTLRDTVILQDTLRRVKTFDYRSTWTDISGLIDLTQDTISLDIKNRESLVVVESVEYKRFLGFLWKTKAIKSRSVDIVSLNPNTTITNAEYKSIEKLK